MKIIGGTADGAVAFTTDLDHGVDPGVLAYERGFAVERPLSASQEGSELVLRLVVRPLNGEPPPVTLPVQADPGLVIDEGMLPVVRQRVAAYAVIRSSRGLLATQFSSRTAVEGLWGMPGGGLDDHEEPAACVLREVAEETSQLVELGPLTVVQTSHWIGRNPHGLIEDFQAVRLVYVGTCPDPTDPVVRDRDGTTNDARWIELDEWQSLSWTVGWRAILQDLFSERRSTDPDG
jgi:8-oxo-dGTP pyrophosphatase MutT (NUDIX family)